MPPSTKTPPPTSRDLHELLATAQLAVSLASEIAKKHRAEHSLSVQFKSDRNLVTTADLECEREIVKIISSRFPEHKILAEESAQTLEPASYGVGYTWVIDPIDGTTNYAHGHFNVGISVACVFNGESIVGVVGAPFLGEVFTATKGGGAFLNGGRIHCTDTKSVSDALITTGFPYNRNSISNVCARIERVTRVCRDLRRLGAASLDLCWVACGRLDAYFESCIQPWDAAAGELIVREAGGVIHHFNYDHELERLTEMFPGDLFTDNLVACTTGIESELLDLLNGVA